MCSTTRPGSAPPPRCTPPDPTSTVSSSARTSLARWSLRKRTPATQTVPPGPHRHQPEGGGEGGEGEKDHDLDLERVKFVPQSAPRAAPVLRICSPEDEPKIGLVLRAYRAQLLIQAISDRTGVRPLRRRPPAPAPEGRQGGRGRGRGQASPSRSADHACHLADKGIDGRSTAVYYWDNGSAQIGEDMPA